MLNVFAYSVYFLHKVDVFFFLCLSHFFRATLLQMKRRYVVNEKRLLQLFSCICPICGSKTKVEKVTSGVLIILNQQCLHCEYRNQWKSQVNASVPAGEDQHLTVGIDITPEIQQVGLQYLDIQHVLMLSLQPKNCLTVWPQ